MSHPLRTVFAMVNRSHLEVVPDLRQTSDQPLTIDCDKCAVQYTVACDDCLVTHVIGREIGRPIEFASDEARVLKLLTEAGLVPVSRFLRDQPVA